MVSRRQTWGRLCLDLGDFASAATYFAQDSGDCNATDPGADPHPHAIVIAPGRLCPGGWPSPGRQEAFTRARQLAVADGNAYGLAFAVLGLGQGRLTARGHRRRPAPGRDGV